MARKKVLVTGGAGRIGGIVRRFLGSKYELSVLDREPVEGVPSLVADLTRRRPLPWSVLVAEAPSMGGQ